MQIKRLNTIVFSAFTSLIFAQSNQVLNSINYCNSKEYDKAKASADAAAVHESTKGSAKMWMWRGKVYQGIYSDTSAKVRALDTEAEEKALESFLTCLRIDAKENIYKADVKGLLVMACGANNYKAKRFTQAKEFEKALRCYDLLSEALPFDFDLGMKRNNITPEKIMFAKFELYKYAGNKEKTKEFAEKLMEIKYKDPKIYTDMVQISLINEKDTTSALKYIEKGKLLFEENTDLTNLELNIYLAQKKTNILKDKLVAAIGLSPDNEILHLILGNLYKETKDLENAEKEYLKAIEIKSDYSVANYNLGVMYFNTGNEWNEKLNKLPLRDPKTKEYETKSNDYFKKAVGYFEKAYEVTPDKATKQRLRQLLLRLGETEKAEKYK